MIKNKPLSALFVKMLKTRATNVADYLGALVGNWIADCGLYNPTPFGIYITVEKFFMAVYLKMIYNFIVR